MARLTAATRKAIPTSDFAGPDRTYPIEDKAHARDALSRASGKPIAGRVRAAVASRYPDIQQGPNQQGDAISRARMK